MLVIMNKKHTVYTHQGRFHPLIHYCTHVLSFFLSFILYKLNNNVAKTLLLNFSFPFFLLFLFFRQAFCSRNFILLFFSYFFILYFADLYVVPRAWGSFFSLIFSCIFLLSFARPAVVSEGEREGERGGGVREKGIYIGCPPQKFL